MMIRPFYGAFPMPILGENGAKSAVAVNFGPCARAILDVFHWYWVVFYGVLWCFGEGRKYSFRYCASHLTRGFPKGICKNMKTLACVMPQSCTIHYIQGEGGGVAVGGVEMVLFRPFWPLVTHWSPFFFLDFFRTFWSQK